MSELWTRAILHIDMDAFFASIEEGDLPVLSGLPVAVTKSAQGTTIRAASKG